MTDTDALLATVRQVASQGERAMIELGWTSANVNWRAALDSLAKEIERLRAEVNEWRDDAELKQSVELERVKAERDEHQRVRGLLFRDLEKALSALRVIASLDPDWTQRDAESVYGIARTAIAEIEGSA